MFARFRLCSSLVLILACACAIRPAPPPEGDFLLSASLVEDLRIGGPDAPKEEVFGFIGHIAEHPDGTVFVADTQVPVVRRYDSGGVYMHNIGARGQGPGEYESLYGMKLTPAGNVAVWDPAQRRVIAFSPDGELRLQFSVESGARSRWGHPFQVDDHGNFYVQKVVRDGELRYAYLKHDPSGRLVETLVGPRIEADSRGMVLPSPQGFMPSFGGEHIVAIDAAGWLVTGHTNDYELVFRRGGLTRRLTREWMPVEINVDERAQWNAILERGSRQINTEFPPVGESKPAFMDFVPGDDGTIWVRRYVEAQERPELRLVAESAERPILTWWEYPTFEVFDPELQPIGRVVLPYEVRVSWIRTDYIWTVQTDEEGNDLAVRYRLTFRSGDL